MSRSHRRPTGSRPRSTSRFPHGGAAGARDLTSSYAFLPETPPPFDRLTVYLASALLALVLLLYLRTAARDIVVGDTPELVTVAVALGIAHPPGYPLFVLLGHLFSLLPLAEIPFRVNLLAVVCHVLTVGLVFATAFRLTGSRAASSVAALALAVNPLFWTWSLVAEVFPLNDLLAAALVYLLVRWEQASDDLRPLVGAAFIAGLGMTNHQTIALIAPGVLYLLWRHRAELLRRPAVFALAALALGLGFLPYLEVLWATGHNPVLSWGDPESPRYLLDLVTRAQYGSSQLVNTPQYQGGTPASRLVALAVSFTLPELVLLTPGSILAAGRLRWYALFVLSAAALAGPGFVAYANVNLGAPAALFVLERFFLLFHVLLAPLVALGVLQSLVLGRRLLAQTSPSQGWEWGAAAAAGLALVASAAPTFPNVDQSDNHVARTFAEDSLATLEDGTVLLVSGEATILPLLYLQVVEGRRPDVTVLLDPLLVQSAPWYRRDVERHYPDLAPGLAGWGDGVGPQGSLAAGIQPRPLATMGMAQDPELPGGYWYTSRGLVLLVQPPSRDLTVREMVDINEALFASYRVLFRTAVRTDTLEAQAPPQYGLAAYRVARILEQARLLDDARAWYERSIAIDPELAPPQKGLGRLALQRGDREAAAGYLRAALARNAADTEARDLLSQATSP